LARLRLRLLRGACFWNAREACAEKNQQEGKQRSVSADSAIQFRSPGRCRAEEKSRRGARSMMQPTAQAQVAQAAENVLRFVILSEAKNLSSI